MDGVLQDAALVVIRFNGITIERFGPAAPWNVGAPVRITLEPEDIELIATMRRAGSLDSARALAAPQGKERFDRLVIQLRELGLITATATANPVAAARVLDEPSAVAVSPPAGSDMILRLPVSLLIGSAGFEAYDHDGGLIARLAPVELVAAGVLAEQLTMDDANRKQARVLGDRTLSADGFAEVAATLWGAGLLVPADAQHASQNSNETQMRQAFRAIASLRQGSAKLAATHDAAELERIANGARRRVKIIPVHVAGNVPPLSTGMILAHARDLDGGRLGDVYDFFPRWITQAVEAPDDGARPDLYLFTDYIWSHETNLEISRAIKDQNPQALIVHGGPDCPAYPGEAEAYLEAHPEVDIAVRGEGEATMAGLLDALAPSIGSPSGPDLQALRAVQGLAYRDGDQIVRTEDRERLTDVDVVPSPYLTGVFDVFGDTEQMGMAIIETNRGCPYGCTFCDWGSATNSRIRKFDLQRVLDEFEWCARNKVPRIFIADANFGIFARDVEIARHVVDLKERYGYPKRFITNYAKNTVKHLKEIVSILAGGGVLSEGLLSLQTMDDATLKAIRRSNIKLEKYDALAKEFHEASMPLFVDLMIGLPGQTTDSLHRDLQQCVDREVNAKCHATELLVNSPMNDPEYRSEHQVVTTRPPGAIAGGVAQAAKAGPALVVSAASFTRDDYQQMDHMRRTYLMSENLGTMRQVTRFARREVGIAEVDLIEAVRRDAMADPQQWPALALVMGTVPDAMVEPGSWSFYIEELRRYCVDVVGIRPGSDLDTVMTVQHAMLPAPGRQFPVALELQHDYAAWHLEVLEAKDQGHGGDWETVVGRLIDLPPAILNVSDPNDVCGRAMGTGSSIETYIDWELTSAVSRAMPGHYLEG